MHSSSVCSDLLVTSPFLSSGSDSLSLHRSFESFSAVTGDLLSELEGSNACGNFDSDSDSDSDSDVLTERERGEFRCCFSSSFRLFFFFFFPV